jgi:hypothetical protein
MNAREQIEQLLEQIPLPEGSSEECRVLKILQDIDGILSAHDLIPKEKVPPGICAKCDGTGVRMVRVAGGHDAEGRALFYNDQVPCNACKGKGTT